MAMHLDPSEHSTEREERQEGKASHVELRPAVAQQRLRTGSLACPGCAMPLRLGSAVRWNQTLACGFCDAVAPTREFVRTGGWPRVDVTVRIVAGR